MRIVVDDPAMLDLVAGNASIERLASGMEFTEGPVWRASTQSLVFSDIPANRLMEWRNGSVVTLRHPCGHPNGNTLDREGRLISCAHSARCVYRELDNGERVVIAQEFAGLRLNSPNDVVVKSDGSIYFTDPPFGIAKHQRELGFSGIYRLAPSGELELLHKEMEAPNGLAFSPDERTLYVDDSSSHRLHAFRVLDDGRLGDQLQVLDMRRDLAGTPDGMKVDKRGNLFVTGPGGVWVISPDFVPLGRIELPEPPANCAWGDDGHSLYVTARQSLYRVRCLTSGHILPG
ncbi:SMP-30/gluconolactonase/LRE family protein [Aurantiacibacter sp. MUD11]|uniref:SMP-30/gluconolactonase/LRE family protein n=1 Tax=Aurantiacibacter sp. MUD11 TaxID=3003265 RepID=UPI0022AB4694|nr:SMP-30/gluconolactonase/LRE family protein [Aurantiacibacter sp. MUD11]WAT18952.1 SMP-30/gluconolactonase/LRE family protein [Aurantiacibacter sp. MUD11]